MKQQAIRNKKVHLEPKWFGEPFSHKKITPKTKLNEYSKSGVPATSAICESKNFGQLPFLDTIWSITIQQCCQSVFVQLHQLFAVGGQKCDGFEHIFGHGATQRAQTPLCPEGRTTTLKIQQVEARSPVVDIIVVVVKIVVRRCVFSIVVLFVSVFLLWSLWFCIFVYLNVC